MKEVQKNLNVEGKGELHKATDCKKCKHVLMYVLCMHNVLCSFA